MLSWFVRFFYPEFQNRIEKQRVKKAYSPPKKDAGTADDAGGDEGSREGAQESSTLD